MLKKMLKMTHGHKVSSESAISSSFPFADHEHSQISMNRLHAGLSDDRG